MTGINLPPLQAEVVLHGLMFRARARTIRAEDQAGQVFAAELHELLPTLSDPTRRFVRIRADRMLRQCGSVHAAGQ